MAKISIIAAVANNLGIGKEGGLLFAIPADLKRFKDVTMGKPVIMGRKTFESIPQKNRPLPGRTNIVVTHDWKWHHDGVEVARSIEAAIAKAKRVDQEEIFIAGGAEIYKQTIGLADRLYLTLVDSNAPADTFFPPYKHLFTKAAFEEGREWKGLKYRFVTLEK